MIITYYNYSYDYDYNYYKYINRSMKPIWRQIKTLCLTSYASFDTVELDFCTEYSNYGCCTRERDDDINEYYNLMVNENQSLKFCAAIFFKECIVSNGMVQDEIANLCKVS